MDHDSFVRAYAGFDTQTDLALPRGWGDLTVYAPTMAPRDRYNSNRAGCLETVTIHFLYDSTGMTSTAHQHGFWDHCVQKKFVVTKDMADPIWRSKYVRFQEGEDRFYTMLWYDAPTGITRGMLWNYNTGIWEEQTQVTSQNTPCCWPGGWTMFETHNLSDNVCPLLPAIRASGTQVLRDDGQWVPLTTDLSAEMAATGTCFGSGGYSFHFHQPNYDWEFHD